MGTEIKITAAHVRAAWTLGRLDYQFRNLQKKIKVDFEKSKGHSRKFYVECSRRLGKSTLLLFLCVEDLLKNPAHKAGFFAPIKEGLRDYIEPIWDKVFLDCPDDLRPTLDSSLTAKFYNGSTIIFRGSNNQQHNLRRGNDFNICVVDEARDVDDLENLIESVIMPSLFSGGGNLLIASTPADSEDHYLFQLNMRAQKERWKSRYTIFDANKFDPDEFSLSKIQEWERETIDKTAWSREYLAEWVRDPNRATTPEWEGKFEIDEIPRDNYFPVYKKYVAMDLGVTDKTAVIFGYYDFLKAKLFIEDEFFLSGSEVRTDILANKIIAKEEELKYQMNHSKDFRRSIMSDADVVYRRISDNNNPMLLTDLNALYGLDFFGTRKDELPAMVNMAREWIKNERVFVSKKCQELIGCLRNGQWDKHRKEIAKSKIYGHYDALMALVYLIRNVDEISNPIPQHYGKTFTTHAINPGQIKNYDSISVLTRAMTPRSKIDDELKRFEEGRI